MGKLAVLIALCAGVLVASVASFLPLILSGKRWRAAQDPKHVSTSFVQRQNWMVRDNMRRYARLSIGFSRKLESHAAAKALNYFA